MRTCGASPTGGKGLAPLAGVPGLQRLRLDAEDLTDRHLEVLNAQTGLQELAIDRARITNQGLGQLNLPALRSLSLGGCTQIDDSGLANLKGLPELQELNLSDSGVSGKDLTGLASMPKLKRVTLSGEQFQGNDASLAAIKKLLPDVVIEILRG